MSLTTDVTPYESPIETIESSWPGSGRARSGSSREEEDLLADSRSSRARDGLRLGGSQLVTRARLRVQGSNTLLQTARRQGFRLVRSRDKRSRGGHFLVSKTGDRLTLVRNQEGHIEVRAAGHSDVIRRLVSAHTRERAVELLQSRGLSVREAALSGGEFQILAEGSSSGQATRLAIQIEEDGSYWADVEKTQGVACADLVASLAEATGGRIVATDFKDAYFASPGIVAPERRIRG